MTNTVQRLRNFSHQRGATLLISLIILMILTIIGISAMSNSGMEANMARNFHMGNTDFQLAETTIENILFLASPGTASNPIKSYAPAKDIIRSVDITTEGNTKTFKMDSTDGTTTDPDPDDYLGPDSGVKTDATVTFLYNLPSEMCPGGAGTGSCNFYSIDATSSLDGSNAGRGHTQNVSIVVP